MKVAEGIKKTLVSCKEKAPKPVMTTLWHHMEDIQWISRLFACLQRLGPNNLSSALFGTEKIEPKAQHRRLWQHVGQGASEIGESPSSRAVLLMNMCEHITYTV
eukprot:s727_g4.t1